MNKVDNRKRIKTIWYFGKKYMALFIVAEICILVSYSVSLLLPLNLTKLIDKVLYGGQNEILPEVIKSYILLFILATVSNLIYAYAWQTLNNHYVVDIKNAVFEKTIFAKATFLSNMNSGDIMSRIDGDSEQFINVVQRNLFHFVNSILLCIGIIYMVVKINGVIAIMLIIAASLPIITTKLCGKLTERFSKLNCEITGIFTGRVFEILKGFREIKLHCSEWWATNQIIQPLKKLITLGNRIRRVDFFVGKGIYLINLSISLVIYGFSVHLIIREELTIGLFLAIIEYIALLHKKLNWVLRIYLDWFARKVSIDRVNEILDSESEDNSGQAIDKINSLEVINLTFGYDKSIVLKNVSFKICKGERVAIVGTSGVGKTTLIGLLVKFYEPQHGKIEINGININNLRFTDIRREVGIVSQEILIFDETIRYNLSFGNNYSDSDLFEVLAKVDLLNFIQTLPDGLDTRISATTNGLSGGQKQMLMIARLLLKKVSVIILDEATSALDIDTEYKIIEELMAMDKEITYLIISHRLASIKRCDRAIVIDNGEAQNIGTHEELLNSSKIYYEMFNTNIKTEVH